jgi:hypothetical protein
MSETRDKMNGALKEYVVPVLRAKGFTGSLPHFRRITPDAIHLLTFQFWNKSGGSFCVEVASCSAEGIMFDGKLIPPNKVTAHDLTFGRLRLGGKNPDHWFKFDDRCDFPKVQTKTAKTYYGPHLDPYAAAAKAVLPFLDKEAEEWWNRPLIAASANRARTEESSEPR